MSILKIRVVLDHEEQVFRDLLVEPKGSMQDLHEILLASFDIPNDQMASFYVSDEHWNKGQEIALMDMGVNEEPTLLMSDTPLDEQLELRSRLLYVYDFLNLRIFYVEVISIEEVDPELEYPYIHMALGELPKMKDPFDLESLMEGVDLDEPRDSVGQYDDLDDDDWEQEGGGMDNIDDYEGLI